MFKEDLKNFTSFIFGEKFLPENSLRIKFYVISGIQAGFTF